MSGKNNKNKYNLFHVCTFVPDFCWYLKNFILSAILSCPPNSLLVTAQLLVQLSFWVSTNSLLTCSLYSSFLRPPFPIFPFFPPRQVSFLFFCLPFSLLVGLCGLSSITIPCNLLRSVTVVCKIGQQIPVTWHPDWLLQHGRGCNFCFMCFSHNKLWAEFCLFQAWKPASIYSCCNSRQKYEDKKGIM